MVTFRRTVQILSLLLFCFLIITTRLKIEEEFYRVESPISPYLYFTTNPLTFVSAATASRSIPAVNYLPLLVMVALVLLLGRFYCGWLCPLGVMIDGAAKIWRPPKRPKPSRWVPSPNLKFYILLIIITLALVPSTRSDRLDSPVGVNIVGFFDPITIAMRAMSFAIQPYLERIVSLLGELYWVPIVKYITEPVYGFLKTYYVTGEIQPQYEYSVVYLAILLGIFGLSKIRRRFWCRYLCPLGAFHALLGRFALWRRRVSPECNECELCGKDCRTEAIDLDDAAVYDTRECILCMDCRAVCPEEAIEFTFVPSTELVRVSPRELQVTRRGLLKAMGASFLTLAFLRTTAHSRSYRTGLLRPPGAVAEEEFLARCIRCGECMRVCPQHALQPALLQFGLEEMWTPVLAPRIGYCEYNCTLCLQVCPTGAIEVLTQRAKQQFRIGTAFFDKDRCIPWAENIDCLVCEEVCPTPIKAIEMRDEEALDDAGNKKIVKRPFVVDAYCIGCGICETKCPVEGLSAILVAARYETRHGGMPVQAAAAPQPAEGPYGKAVPTSDDTLPADESSTPMQEDRRAPSADPYGTNPYR